MIAPTDILDDREAMAAVAVLTSRGHSPSAVARAMRKLDAADGLGSQARHFDPAQVVKLEATITDEQLANWMAYTDGREVTVDAQGFEVIMSATGRAAFRHRVATDPDAAAKCVSWDGPPPTAIACPFVPGGECNPARCRNHGCQS